jgi:DNA-binding NtrC family response regulator
VITAPATALIIDDEGMVRRLVRRMLEPEVCQVLEAGDGEAGLRLIERCSDVIDVVLTDLLMPGIDGYDVVDVLATYRPELPVACMSGFASHTSVGRRLLVPFIPKPFDAEALRALLEPLLAQARALREQARADGLQTAEQRSAAQDLWGRVEAARAEAIDLVAAAHELRRRRSDQPPAR